jgi:site-specific recombinase XerD
MSGACTTGRIIRRLAQKLRRTPQEMERAVNIVFDTINQALAKGDIVTIERFGALGPIPLRSGFRLGMPAFHPATGLMDRLNSRNGMRPVVIEEPARDQLLPVRPEDNDIIKRWVSTRRPINLRSTRDVLYGPKIERPLSDASRYNQEKTLRTFARRLPVPLTRIGLTTVHGVPIISLDAARDQVAIYAEGFRARAVERWKRLHPELAAHPEWTVPAWRTHGWTRLVRFGNAFYEWLEEEGIRPANTNPFAGVRRFRVYDPKRIRPIVKEWFNRLLSYRGLTVRERAMIFLLANGLRRVEVTRLRLEHLDLANRQMVVLGKGSARSVDPRPKIRTVPLLPWTLKALDAYLVERHDSTNPLVFYNRLDGPVHVVTIAQIFTDVMARVFYKPEDAEIKQAITPHALRRYFVTEALRRGVQINALMRATGHATLSAMQPYIGLVESDVRTEFHRVSAEPWF